MKIMKPAAGFNHTTSNTVERVAKIAVKFLIWHINHIKIHFCAYNTSAISPGNTTRRAICRGVINRYGGVMCIRFIRAVTTHSSAICVVD
jgi:hypothetical protein